MHLTEMYVAQSVSFPSSPTRLTAICFSTSHSSYCCLLLLPLTAASCCYVTGRYAGWGYLWREGLQYNRALGNNNSIIIWKSHQPGERACGCDSSTHYPHIIHTLSTHTHTHYPHIIHAHTLSTHYPHTHIHTRHDHHQCDPSLPIHPSTLD